MKTAVILSAVLALFVTTGLAQSKGNPDDEAAIRKVLATSRESVEKKDADLRAGLYTEDAVFYNAFGVEREGQDGAMRRARRVLVEPKAYLGLECR